MTCGTLKRSLVLLLCQVDVPFEVVITPSPLVRLSGTRNLQKFTQFTCFSESFHGMMTDGFMLILALVLQPGSS
jgi:hypothetical protein